MNEGIINNDYEGRGAGEIYILDLLDTWRRNWIRILLLAAAGAAAGLLLTLLLVTPTYTATSSMYVVSSPADNVLNIADLNLGSSLTGDYVYMIRSRMMVQKVIDATGTDLSVEELRSMLNVTNVSGTRVIRISVTSPDPVQAMSFANTFLDQTLMYLPGMMGMEDRPPIAVDAATLPKTADNLRPARNALIGLAAGLAAGLGLFAAIYLLNDGFDSSEDVEKYLGMAPMAEVPRNGQKQKGGYYYSGHKPRQGSEGSGKDNGGSER